MATLASSGAGSRARLVADLVPLLAALSLVAGCAGDRRELVEAQMFSMGTWVDVSFEAVDREQAGAVLRDVQALLEQYERDYYPWAPGELQRVNASLRAGQPIEVSAELAELLRDAKRLSAASEGLFEPAVAELVELWSFHSGTEIRPEPPAEAAIRAWLETRAGIAALEIEEDRVAATSRHVQLDLGAIAKGKAVDRILALLREREIGNALVNIGGDLGTIGARDGRAWRIGIRDPRGARAMGVVELADGEAAFTSGDYERYYEHEGRRLHHILDPETGRPTVHTRAVTVIANDGTTADAAATALFVAGPERWRRIARQLGVRLVLRVDASGAVETTEEMAARLGRANGNPPQP